MIWYAFSSALHTPIHTDPSPELGSFHPQHHPYVAPYQCWTGADPDSLRKRAPRHYSAAGAAGRALGILPVQRPDFYYRRTRDTRRMDGARPRSYAYRPGDHLRHRELRTIAPRGANRTFQNRTFIQLMHISPTYLHICYFPAHPPLHISQRLSRCTNV